MPVATTVPLNAIHEAPFMVAAGVRLVAVDQIVEAAGLTLTVTVDLAELPRNPTGKILKRELRQIEIK